MNSTVAFKLAPKYFFGDDFSEVGVMDSHLGFEYCVRIY